MGGKTWGQLTTRPFMGRHYAGGYCEGSTIAIPGTNILAFSTPFALKSRANLSIFFSSDSGVSWPESVNIDKGSTQYSSMLGINSTHLAIVYEGGCLWKRSMPCWIRFRILDITKQSTAKLSHGAKHDPAIELNI